MTSESLRKRMDRPLTCKIESGQLVIRVGFDVLEFAATEPDYGPFREWKVQPKVIDKKAWAKDICDELLKEEEDGSSPLSNLLDEVILKAGENGSIGLDYEQEAQ